MMSKISKTIAAAGLSLFALSSYAAPVTLVGTTVNYVFDDTQAAIALFGTPTIVGDDVRFLPPAFRAESANGAGIQVATANFIFDRVYSTNNMEIGSLKVVEFGDYKIVNGDSVQADLLLTASSNNNFADYTSDSGFFGANGDSAGLQTWTMSATVDPASAFVYDLADDIAVSIQNTLTATTDQAGELAWIQKKLSFTAVTAVPVPAAVWLFGSALIGLITVGRRKRA
jgi:hypothetical protein